MSAWHTGRPTESGDYIVKYARLGKGPRLDIDHYNVKTDKWYWYEGRVMRWCPVPEDSEEAEA